MRGEKIIFTRMSLYDQLNLVYGEVRFRTRVSHQKDLSLLGIFSIHKIRYNDFLTTTSMALPWFRCRCHQKLISSLAPQLLLQNHVKIFNHGRPISYQKLSWALHEFAM